MKKKQRSLIALSLGLLAGVASSDTRWSFVCDIGKRVFYLKSYKNPQLRFVDLRKIDFSCARPTAMLDAHAGLEGDITGAYGGPRLPPNPCGHLPRLT